MPTSPPSFSISGRQCRASGAAGSHCRSSSRRTRRTWRHSRATISATSMHGWRSRVSCSTTARMWMPRIRSMACCASPSMSCQGGRLFIISRLSPPTGFARLRARGRLRLTLEEAAGLARMRNAGITPEEIERLHARTHGWAAGFILLLQNREVRSSAVSAPDADTPSVIFDYLAEEVLQRFNPATQEALLRLAYLPQITVPMADELGIAAESRNTLFGFAQRGFLVTVIPAEPQTVYQLHPLLREFLESRAEITGSAEEIRSE